MFDCINCSENKGCFSNKGTVTPVVFPCGNSLCIKNVSLAPLTSTKRDLVSDIRSAQEQLSILDHDYREKSAILKNHISALRSLNTVCEKCGGAGKYLRSRACAEDDIPDENNPEDYSTCYVCRGSGVVSYSGE